ncbi:MAG: MFS transporter, partial [Candidatus Levyibacteriota bacterium]
ISFISFILIERVQIEPVVDLKFFKIPTFSASIVTSFISFGGMLGGLFLIPIFAQSVLGYSVTKSGYIFIPMAIALMISAQIGARLSTKIPPRILTSVGMFFSAFMLFLFAGIDVRWTFFDITWRLMLFAVGLGLGLAPLTNATTSTVPIHEVGVASSILALARNIAGAFGVAVFATILSNSITANLLLLQIHSAINTTNPTVLQTAAMLMISKANILAYGTVFRTASLLVALGGISALFVRESKKDFTHTSEPIEI